MLTKSSSVSVSPTITIDETTENSFKISWTGILGVTDGYTVEVNGSQHKVSSTEFQAENLKSYSMYFINVFGATSDGERYSGEIVVLTDPTPPVLKVAAIGSSAGSVAWEKVPDASGYVSRITDLAGKEFGAPRSHHLNKFEFSGLEPYR